METKKQIPKELKEEYRKQARYRAGRNIYDLVEENNLVKMWTLTYGEEAVTDRKQALNDFKKFMKRLRYNLNRKIPYVAVMEVQKEREKKYGEPVLHFHIAMEDFYIKKAYFQEIWKHGNVRYSTFKDGRKIPKNKTAVATYMSKYLKKDMKDTPELEGQKMYLTSKGLKKPPKGHGIADKKIKEVINNTCRKYEIKDRAELTYYELETDKIPNDEIDLKKLSEAINTV